MESGHLSTSKQGLGHRISVMILGVLIFIDYFNCLTVGSVMRPVTDRHKSIRAKLSYIIDATTTPVYIITIKAPGQPQLRHLFSRFWN